MRDATSVKYSSRWVQVTYETPSVHEAGLTLLGLPASKGMLRQIALSLSRFRIQAKEIESAQTTLGERDTEEVVRIGEDGRNQIRYPGFGGQKSGT